MKKRINQIIVLLISIAILLAFVGNKLFNSNKESYIVKDAQSLQDVLKKTLGLPDMVEASPKVPKIAFIDQVISHDLIEQFPSYQIDDASYDTLSHLEHLIPGSTGKKDSFIFFKKKETPNHCDWMVKGFLAVAGEGNHEIYLPSNSPIEVDNNFVIPYPQWRKIIRKMDKNKGIDIINCSYSYGSEIYPHESYEAVKRGALVIVAAGNDYDSDKTSYRENYTKLYRLANELNSENFKGAMLIVGAYNPFQRDLISYSNRPFEGNGASYAYFVSAPCFYIEGDKAHMNGGTSIAAAYTSAVAALLMKKFPTATGKEIAHMIKTGSLGTHSLVNYASAVKGVSSNRLNLDLLQKLSGVKP